MNIDTLNKDLIAIVEKRVELNNISYNDERYDDLEEELHDLEDDFISEYGDFLEEILTDIHDEYCPDDVVLSPIAYMAKNYKKEGNAYVVKYNDGVSVNADDFEGDHPHLIVMPNPAKIVLMTKSGVVETLWSSEKISA